MTLLALVAFARNMTNLSEYNELPRVQACCGEFGQEQLRAVGSVEVCNTTAMAGDVSVKAIIQHVYAANSTCSCG